MANILRTALRKLLDHEVGVLGVQFDRLEAKVQDNNDALQGLLLRFERLQSRIGMRMMRADREPSPRGKSDEEILAELAAQAEGRWDG